MQKFKAFKAKYEVWKDCIVPVLQLGMASLDIYKVNSLYSEPS